MRDILDRLKQIEESQSEPSGPQVGDEFGLSFSDDLEISTTITDVLEDGIVVDVDDEALAHIQENGAFLYDGEIVEEELSETEAQKGLDGKRCWKGYKRMGTKMKGGKRVDNCVKVGEGIDEGQAKPEDPNSMYARLMGDISEIQNGALDGNDMADDIADELGDYLRNGDAPEGSHYEKAISIVMDALHDGPEAQADAAEEAISFLHMEEEKARGNPNYEEGIEEADVDTGEVAFRPETGKEKYPAGYASDGAKIMHIVNDLMMRIKDEDLWDQTMKSLNDLENGKGTKQDVQNVMKIYNSAKKQGLTQKYDDAVKKGVQGWDDPEEKEESAYSDTDLQRIKSLSGIQTENHGPEVDGFLEKLAAMDDDQEKYETAEKAYAGKFGPKIQQAINDMYNEAKKSVGDMDDIMDDVLDMIEKDYGPKEDIDVDEAEYQGRKVSLGKPTRGDVKKFKVYVRDPKTGNVKKVNFGDPNMKIKKSNPARRKSFRARHNCDNPGPRTKARYWSCRKW